MSEANHRAQIEYLQKLAERYRKALEKISCPHVSEAPLWWQIEARKALET